MGWVAATLVLLLLLAVSACLAMFTASGDIDDYEQASLVDRGGPTRGEVKVTFLGTTMLLVDDGTTQLMLDAYLTHIPLLAVLRNKMFATNRGEVDKALDEVGADRVKAIFVSHSHYDHAFDAAYLAQRTGAHLYGSESTLNIGRGGQVPESRMTVNQPGASVDVGDFTVAILASKHSPTTVGGEGTEIPEPLAQPARPRAYKEGGSYDYLVQHGEHAMLVKASANFIPGALDDVRADVVFLGTATLGKQDDAFTDAFYDHTIGKVRPNLVVPMHWNNFFKPLSSHLRMSYRVIDKAPAGFNVLKTRLHRDGIQFGVLQGYGSVLLFGAGSAPSPR